VHRQLKERRREERKTLEETTGEKIKIMYDKTVVSAGFV
jgi:hypothetical protein